MWRVANGLDNADLEVWIWPNKPLFYTVYYYFEVVFRKMFLDELVLQSSKYF